MPRADVRTPLIVGDTRHAGGRIYRKQVLRTGRVRYQGRDLHFTPEYLDSVIAAFRAKSHDTVPVMLADRSNDHTMAVLDGGGEVLDLERDGDELWATVRLSDAAAAQVEQNRRLGVSVRIKHDYEAGDGRRWPAALQHLLLTWDPRVNGMKPWQQVELSDTDAGVPVLDLSDLDFEIPREGGPTVPEDNTTSPPQLSPGELIALRAILAQNTPATLETQQAEVPPAAPQTPPPAPAAPTATPQQQPQVPAAPAAAADNPDNPDDVNWDRLSDADVDRIIAGVLGEQPAGEQQEQPVGAGPQLSNPAGGDPQRLDALDLANAQIAELQRSQAQLTAQLDAAAYERERDQLVRDTGLPPGVIDLARPLLEGAHHDVQLSNGTAVDAGQVMRQVLTQIGQTLRVLDLSAEFAARADTDATTEAQHAEQHRRELARQVLTQTGLSGLISQPAGN